MTEPVNRRTVLGAGLAATVGLALPDTAGAAAISGTYGSGVLSDWTVKPKAISTPTQIRNTRDTNGVYMFGDSIALQDGKELAQRLYDRDGSLMAVNNWGSRPTAPTVDALEEWATTYGLPQRILIASGSNDIFNPPVFRAQVDRAMTICAGATFVAWANIHVSRWAQTCGVQVADQRNTGWINTQLADAQDTWENLRIVRWAELLAGKPGYRIPAYLTDGVHTTVPLGQAARNEMIVQELT